MQSISIGDRMGCSEEKQVEVVWSCGEERKIGRIG